MDFEKVLAFIKAMNREHVVYKLFGALALSAHGFVRATEDADFFIQPTIENVERLKTALRSVWDDPGIDEISTDELCSNYPAVAYYPAGENFHIDFVTRLGEAFAYDDLAAEDGVLGDVPICVVTPRTLYEMKRDTVRYKDKIDADALRRKFGWGVVMPVYKYRRIEDMPGDRWLTPGDPAIVRSIHHVWGLAALIGPTGIPTGVHKYTSIEEMSADREAWEDRRIQRIRDKAGTK